MGGVYRGGWIPEGDLERSRMRGLEVGDIVGYDYAAWEVTHLQPMSEPDGNGYDTRVTFTRRFGPKHERENQFGDMAGRIRSGRWSALRIYRNGRVYLCSCCGNPAPCRMQIAEEQSQQAANTFDERLSRMGPGLCYGCGEVITQRQERLTFPGDHADFPGRSGPTFHTRKACLSERQSYARRAGMTVEAEPLSAEVER